MLTQEQLAARSGLTDRTVRDLESDHPRRPRHASLRLLADALGLDDEERAALRLAALGATAAGSAPPQAARRADGFGVVPAQLPTDVAAFTGRTEYLAQLDARLPGERTGRSTAVPIVTVSGTAGVGKTSLAVHWAHRVAHRFPDGQLYLDLRGYDPQGEPVRPEEALRAFLGALGVAPDRVPVGTAMQAGLYRSLLAGKRLLVLLDNAVEVEQVRPLLPGSSGCMVVVTSRHRLSGLVSAEGADPIMLDMLTPREATDLLIGRLGAERVSNEPGPVAEIATWCAGLPLALTIVAARAAGRPAFSLAAVASALGGAGAGLEAFADDDASTELRAVFSWSYRLLSPGAARLFRLLGLHPGSDITLPAAASLDGGPPASVRRLLGELVDAHLLTEHVPGRYASHDLLRTFAGELARETHPAGDRRAALHRVLDHYLHTAHAAERTLRPYRESLALPPPRSGVTPVDFADPSSAAGWLSSAHETLLAAVTLAADLRLDMHTWQLAWALNNAFDRQGHWHDLIRIQTIALGAGERLGDVARKAGCHLALASAHARLGSADEADRHYRSALELYRAAGDELGEAHTHSNIARLLDQQGRYPEALRSAQRALALYRAGEHPRWEARALSGMGWHHIQVGEHRTAIGFCRQALDRLRRLGDRDGEAATWDSLGYAHYHLGEHREAVTCYLRALAMHREDGQRYNEALVLDHLGDAHRDAGDLPAARRSWDQALRILDELDHPDAGQLRRKLSVHQPAPLRS